ESSWGWNSAAKFLSRTGISVATSQYFHRATEVLPRAVEIPRAKSIIPLPMRNVMPDTSILDFSERNPGIPNCSLRQLVELYFAAPAFLDLRESTKFDYTRVIRWLLAQAGDVPARIIETRHIYALRDLAFAARKRRFANYVVQVIR